MNLLPYTVQTFDTWDKIAFKAYGQPERFPEIIDANPRYPIGNQPTAGDVIGVPVSAAVVIATEKSGLPPWRR